jgi:hypothetical protein
MVTACLPVDRSAFIQVWGAVFHFVVFLIRRTFYSIEFTYAHQSRETCAAKRSWQIRLDLLQGNYLWFSRFMDIKMPKYVPTKKRDSSSNSSYLGGGRTTFTD